ncbi:rod shape-determining protein RodA [Psychrobacillus psychrodurans]|uniref:FtsW/RodA/SpoVE family cell cycle protein n=1 Tax=Psychrobacillus psychrodurans TaxID=126157 RepID=UPI001F4E6E1A|nr:FtsW/RodA/SpoVE family cell cycle protein [Psychrobacillus psychrodurans]MCK1998356.1 rod shape-determining protein RodA [Psychrobacillus psychrodurans]
MKENKFNNLDIIIYLVIILFMIVSCTFIYSAQKFLPYDDNFALKQAIWFIFGMIISAIVYFFDFEQIKKLSLYLYIFGNLILALLIISPETIAPNIKGIKAWFLIPGFGSIQPSEFMKIFLILYLARVISNHNEKYPIKSLKLDFFLLFKILAVTLIPLILVAVQPDLGTGMVMVSIMVGMILISGINMRIILSVFVTVLISLGLFVLAFLYRPNLLLYVMDRYQIERINSWLDPFADTLGTSYQLSLSITSIGSGMLTGKGYGNGVVAVPEAHSDFIFTTISEEFGFVGSAGIILMYYLIIYRIFRTAYKNKGEYETLIAAGVISMILFHVFENIGMVIGLVPITGIPLPLFSYGGSSILATIFALSIIINISLNTKDYMFGGEDD